MGWNDKPPKESLIPGKNESSLPGRERRGTERLLPSPPEPVQLGGGCSQKAAASRKGTAGREGGAVGRQLAAAAGQGVVALTGPLRRGAVGGRGVT